MNTPLAWLATALLIQPALGLLAGSFTSESPTELSASFDADGDGRPDLIVVDKPTGVRQLALQQADGSFIWSDPASTGVDGVTALGAGRFHSTGTADGFAVAGPTANRVQQFPDVFGAGVTVPTTGIGPNVVVALDLTGDALDDLVIATEWDNPPDATHLAGVQTVTGGLSILYPPVSELGLLSQGNPARFTSSGPWILGAMRSPSTGRQFITRSVQTSSGFSNGPTLSGLATNAMWAWGEFGAGTNAQFLFYTPGGSALTAPGLSASDPSQLIWTPGNTFDLGQPIAGVMVLSNSGGDLLLVIFGDGLTAITYDFNGSDAPTARQTLTAPAGMKFSLAGALGGGDFLLLHGPNGGQGNSAGWQRWSLKGARHTLTTSGVIPALTSAQSHANVLLYGANPDSATDAPLLQILQAGQWSIGATLNSGLLQVTQEAWRGATLGLGSAAVINVQTTVSSPAGVFPVVNQRSSTESAVVLGPPAGAALADVTFAPAPGTYHLGASPLQVRLTATPPAPVFYRTSTVQPWTAYDPNTPPTVSVTTTFFAYAAGTAPTPIRTGSYVIADAPPVATPVMVDANQNGLPDIWEQAFGLSDPNGDADGDGFTNLQEYMAGTDPLDPSSKPSAGGIVQLTVQAPGPGAPPGSLCEIVWPSSPTGAILETTTDLAAPAGWSSVSNTTSLSGGMQAYYQPDTAQETHRFFRLRFP